MAFDAINAQLQGMGLGFPALTPDNYESVLSGIQDLNVLKLQLDGIVQFVQGLKAYTDGVAQLNTVQMSLPKEPEIQRLRRRNHSIIRCNL